MSEQVQKQSRIKDLIARGKEQGYLTYAEVNDHLPEDISEPDQVEDIIQMINDMGIQVFEEAPDADTLLMEEGDSSADEIAAAEAAAALAAVETELGRTTDPVRMYMREMGVVDLLTREGEIAIAKRIEEGTRDVLHALAYFPDSVASVLRDYDRVVAEEMRLEELLIGYLNPVDEVPQPGASNFNRVEVKKEDADTDIDEDDEEEAKVVEEEEVATGPDPVEAAERFKEIREKLEIADAAIAKYGREHKKTNQALSDLGDVFQFLKLPPKISDPIIARARDTLTEIRTYEKHILTATIRQARVPRAIIVRSFLGNEGNEHWLDELIKENKEYAESLELVREDILRSQRKIASIAASHDLSVSYIKDINRRMSIGEARARRAKKEMVEANLRLVISIAKN